MSSPPPPYAMQCADRSSMLKAQRHLKVSKKEASLCFARGFPNPNPFQVTCRRNVEEDVQIHKGSWNERINNTN